MTSLPKRNLKKSIIYFLLFLFFNLIFLILIFFFWIGVLKSLPEFDSGNQIASMIIHC